MFTEGIATMGELSRKPQNKRMGGKEETRTPDMLCKIPQRRIKWFGDAETRMREVLVGVGVGV